MTGSVAHSQRIPLIALETRAYLSDDALGELLLNSRINELAQAAKHSGLQSLTRELLLMNMLWMGGDVSWSWNLHPKKGGIAYR